MSRHSNRNCYFVEGEGVLYEPPELFGRCPHHAAAAMAPNGEKPPPFKFGRVCRKADALTEPQQKEMIDALKRLGKAMNADDQEAEDSNIPAGYTYLGQFIAHEITFDRTKGLPAIEANPGSWRSPQIDLDGLYSERPSPLYEDNARLKIGETYHQLFSVYPNDLPREKKTRVALVSDPRNDENLATAQTVVAFIRFHNNVVKALKNESPPEQLFERAKAEVVRHFQWIILKDYLRTVLDANVLDDVEQHGPRRFRIEAEADLFMPLEFSGACFRFGHSMVQRVYEWNKYHERNDPAGVKGASLSQLFEQTEFSGIVGKSEDNPSVTSDWIIDWRRFYKFPPELGYAPPARVNHARKIDTFFNLHLDKMTGFPIDDIPLENRSITIRNLLRGFALSLATGEEVADCIGEPVLKPDEIINGPHAEFLDTPRFRGRTPLWYYVLKEAELAGGNHLGRVGSRIVAETLIGILKKSPYSILNEPKWYPRFTRRGTAGTDTAVFEMVDLLDFAEVVNPLGGS
jgi:signal recognition particle subunit SEC65